MIIIQKISGNFRQKKSAQTIYFCRLCVYFWSWWQESNP
nr:MAG TPA: hypothetical protein [Caudoviricetes sp.]